MNDLPLKDLAILVLEDEFLIALDIEEACRAAGARAVTIMSRLVPDGATDPVVVDGHDAAVLDLKLSGVSTLSAARALAERGVPFIFATGYDDEHLAEFAGVPVVGKPFAASELVGTLAREIERVSGR